ncbi:hypothetical protein N7530_007940 [Penicillium desertorum]|uniref:Uncharacterized protein n=1 Tax=Penicillium desertorum TaxID=1303715 RepID=A0A9W9WNS3_9EURO|nr:hypothetical protein N7530_007940 [Penicillium desertorum]
MANIEHEGESEETFDSDYDEGDAVLARGWPRNHHNLAKHGFRPVWPSREGYPGDEIPEDIREWLDGNAQRTGLAVNLSTTTESTEIIGPLRSLAWLAGLDELVEAIDHPAYVIEDDRSHSFRGRPVVATGSTGRRRDRTAHDMGQGLGKQSTVTAVPGTIPAAVKDRLNTHKLRDLYPSSRIQSPHHVKCIKVPFDKNMTRLEANIRKLVGAPLESRDLWFRGLSFGALESNLAFFIPERSSHGSDNEFGPGFYTADTLHFALAYIRTGGAIMVFKDPDMHSTEHLPLEIAQQPIPVQYASADFIKGAISSSAQAGRRVPVPTQSEDIQLVACSYKGCKALSESLELIIFVERA